MIDFKQLSFEQLVELYHPLIKSQMKQLNGTKHYDELYQVGLIALWEAQKRFCHNKGHFPSFVKKYIRGRMLQFLYKEKKSQDYATTLQNPEILELIPAEVPTQWKTIPLRPILSVLSKREQLWLIEFLEKGKSTKQIAKEYNVTVDTVKTWRQRAIKKIREYVKN